MNFVKTARYYCKNPLPQLSAEEEQVLIEDAKNHDHDALVALVAAYAPLIIKHAPDKSDESSSLVGAALWNSILNFDPTEAPRLGGVFRLNLLNEYNAAARESGFISVPESTLKPYRKVMAAAGGDLDVALDILDPKVMSRRRFLAAHAVVDRSMRVDLEEWIAIEEEEEYFALAYLGMDALDSQEHSVVSRCFGFEEVCVDDRYLLPEGSAPLSDRLVGVSLGLSRPRVQQIRTQAMATMRRVLIDEGCTIDPHLEVAE